MTIYSLEGFNEKSANNQRSKELKSIPIGCVKRLEKEGRRGRGGRGGGVRGYPRRKRVGLIKR